MKKALLMFSLLFLYLISCSKGMQDAYEQLSEPVYGQPKLTTRTAGSITAYSALSGGEIEINTSSAGVISRGVCWSTKSLPTLVDSCTVDGAGTGSFNSVLSGLKPETIYFLRAYASYSGGVSYGNEIQFKTDQSINDITSFQFIKTATKNTSLLSSKTGIIVGNEITVFIENGTDVSQLTADFTFTGLMVKVNNLTQVSGSTVNNYTSDLTYQVITATGLVKNFTVKIQLTYNVVYDANGADGGSVPVDLNSYSSGSVVQVMGNSGLLTKSGNSFVGWNTLKNGSGINYNGGQTLSIGSGQLTLYANWTTQPTYKIIYDKNGAEGGTLPAESGISYIQGMSYKISGNMGSLVKSGYMFAGWNTDINGGGVLYLPGQTGIMGGAELKLYAKWVSSNSYRVIYHPCGTCDPATVSGTLQVDSNSYKIGQTAVILGNKNGFNDILTKSGYFFGGWNSDASGTGAHIDPGQSVVIENGDIHLYAVWSQWKQVWTNFLGGAMVSSYNKPVIIANNSKIFVSYMIDGAAYSGPNCNTTNTTLVFDSNDGVTDAGSLGRSCAKPSFAVYNSDTYVASLEEVYDSVSETFFYKPVLKKYNGTEWSLVGDIYFGELASYGSEITLAMDQSGTPYVAYKRASDQVLVIYKKESSGNWTQVSSPNINDPYSVFMGFRNGNLYLSYVLGSTSFFGYLSGGSWVSAGSANNSNGFQFSVEKNNIYVVNYNGGNTRFFKNEVNSQTNSGDSCSGSCIYVNAGVNPGFSIAVNNGTVYLAYGAYGYSNKLGILNINASNRTENVLGLMSSPIQINSMNKDFSGEPSLFVMNGVPYVAISSGSCIYIYKFAP